ncbi:MAG: HipA domain-containing protein [Gemmatimonadaceae bacterium]
MADGALPRELVVLLQGRVAGVLRKGETVGSHVFAYDSSWRDQPAAFPLSLSLPLASQEHLGPAVTFYLRGLLPDSEARLNAIAHQYGVAPDDPFALLAQIGEDCPGAVQFARPERVAELEGEGPGLVDELTDHDVAELLRELGTENSHGRPAVNTGQFSLPGALAKVALTWDANAHRWGRPSGRAATTHILKPPLRGVRYHNENEHLCLELARHVGCPAAASSILRVEDQRAIVVERYDRERHGDVIVRLHQEDLSQALGVNPRLKYAGEGAPGIAEAVTLLRDQSSRALEDVDRFLRAVALNWVIAGTDAHPRNYSVLIAPRGNVTLAPLYDLASALLLPTRTPVPELPFAMAVAGRTTLGAITYSAWEAQAKQLRLSRARVLGEIGDLLRRVKDAAPGVADAAVSAGVDERFATRFGSRVRARAIACAKELPARV